MAEILGCMLQRFRGAKRQRFFEYTNFRNLELKNILEILQRA